jgi:hypothetical protein
MVWFVKKWAQGREGGWMDLFIVLFEFVYVRK